MTKLSFSCLALTRRLTLRLVHIKNRLKTINLFRKESSTTQLDNPEQVAIIATHLYIILFTASISILILFNILYPVTVSVTVLSPSFADFERYEALYASTLSCQCKHASVAFETFFSITPTYHQVNHTLNASHSFRRIQR